MEQEKEVTEEATSGDAQAVPETTAEEPPAAAQGKEVSRYAACARCSPATTHARTHAREDTVTVGCYYPSFPPK